MQKKGGVIFLIFSLIVIILLPVFYAAGEKASDKCRNVKYQSLCYSLAAQSERDESICENIQDKALKENCINTAEPINRSYITAVVIITAVLALVLVIGMTMIRKRLMSLKSKKIYSAKSFVADSRSKGYSNESIRSHLIKNKVPADVIDKVLPKK